MTLFKSIDRQIVFGSVSSSHWDALNAEFALHIERVSSYILAETIFKISFCYKEAIIIFIWSLFFNIILFKNTFESNRVSAIISEKS